MVISIYTLYANRYRQPARPSFSPGRNEGWIKESPRRVFACIIFWGRGDGEVFSWLYCEVYMIMIIDIVIRG